MTEDDRAGGVAEAAGVVLDPCGAAVAPTVGDMRLAIVGSEDDTEDRARIALTRSGERIIFFLETCSPLRVSSNLTVKVSMPSLYIMTPGIYAAL